MAVTIARVTEVLRWPFQVVPAFLMEFLEKKWKVLLPLISRKVAIAGARAVAIELVEAGEVQVVIRERHHGFYRLDLIKKGYARDRLWCVDIWNVVHYEGRWTKVPNLAQVKSVSFRLRPAPHPKGDPTQVGSHIEMLIH